MQIKDRVFIVTGASSGIGLSTAIALSDRGAKVALLAEVRRPSAPLLIRRPIDRKRRIAQSRPIRH